MTQDAKPLQANGSNFTLDAHSTGRCRWFYGSPHPLATLLEPGYFDGIRDHRPRRGDLITTVYCVPDEPLERAELIVITGVDQLGPHGERPTIVVEPSGPA